MTYELVQGVSVLVLVVTGLVLRAHLNSVLEAARLKTSAMAISASSFRSVLLTLRSSSMQNLTTHTSFVLALLALALPLLGAPNAAILPALTVLWLAPIVCTIFNESNNRGNARISRTFALATSIVLVSALALEGSILVKMICIIVTIIIGREARITTLASNQWNTQTTSSLPLHFAQFATNVLLFIVIFKELLIANDIVIYACAIACEIFSHLIAEGLFSLPNLKRSQNAHGTAMLVLMFIAVLGLIAWNVLLGRSW